MNKPLSNFEKYDTINETRRIALFSNFYLPIEFTTITNKEQTYKSIILTEQEAIDEAVEKILSELLNEIGNEEKIVNKQINTYNGSRIYRSRSDNRSNREYRERTKEIIERGNLWKKKVYVLLMGTKHLFQR